jgi:hypothetical protein
MEPMTDAQAESLLAEHLRVRSQVQAQYDGLTERLQTLGGTVYYDPEDAWFLLSIGGPSNSVALEMADEWSWRVDPQTWQILGLEIPDVEAFERAYPPIADSIQYLVQFAASQPRTHVPVPIGATRKLAEGLRVLVPT